MDFGTNFVAFIRSIKLNQWADIATIGAGIAAVLVLLYTARQIRQTAAISKGQFWLELEKMAATHDAIHVRLRSGGDWSEPGCGPNSVEEWSQVEDYMGFFEHCQALLERGLIDWSMFKDLFGYRIDNILANEIIVNAKLRSTERKSWRRFLKVCSHLGHKRV